MPLESRKKNTKHHHINSQHDYLRGYLRGKGRRRNCYAGRLDEISTTAHLAPPHEDGFGARLPGEAARAEASPSQITCRPSTLNPTPSSTIWILWEDDKGCQKASCDLGSKATGIGRARMNEYMIEYEYECQTARSSFKSLAPIPAKAAAARQPVRH
jgi:hypothetical protein